MGWQGAGTFQPDVKQGVYFRFFHEAQAVRFFFTKKDHL